MSVQLTYLGNTTVVETLETNVPAAGESRRRVTHDGFNTNVVLTSTSTPPVTEVAAFEQDLTAGAATIDLTSLTGTNGASVDGTGLRVQAIKIKAKSTNANAITIAQGATNGYDGFGTSFQVTLDPDAEVILLTQDAGTDIGATNKTLDLSGTGTEGVQVIIVMG